MVLSQIDENFRSFKIIHSSGFDDPHTTGLTLKFASKGLSLFNTNKLFSAVDISQICGYHSSLIIMSVNSSSTLPTIHSSI